MIYPISSFARALAIMHILQSSEELQFHKQSCYIEAYQNGFEQGITIWGFDSGIAYFVADHRNGDTPRVHKGEYAMSSVSADAYKHQHNFKSVEECADWLINDITKELDLQAASRNERNTESAAS